jgi:glycosyltransferase involved in cell wall biosynthesis
MSNTIMFNNRHPGISIIICCYNSVKKLPKTIQHIGFQKVTKDFKWEIIIIDNASKDNTSELAQKVCAEYLIDIPFKIVYESNPGLSNARKRGIREAKFEFLLFCDDDNWLFPDYVQLSFEIMINDHSIGVLGGQSIGEYETSPPGWFLQNIRSFAIGKQNDNSGDVTYKRGAVWGAGFVVRKSVFEILDGFGFDFILTDRNGDSLSSGGDRELCLIVKNLGYKIYYDENLVLKHFMPSTRFNYPSFLNLSYQNGKSSFVNDVYNGHVRIFGLYFFTNLFITSSKLIAVIFLRLFCKLTNNSSSVKYTSDRRYFYFLGRLHTIFQFNYCKDILNKVSGLKNKIHDGFKEIKLTDEYTRI